MANQLKMEQVFAILALHQARLSNREIARKLGFDRETVSRHLRLPQTGPNPARQAPLGSKPATDAPIGSGALAELGGDGALGLEGSKPASQAPLGSAGKPQAGAPTGGGFVALLVVRTMAPRSKSPFRMRLAGRVCWALPSVPPPGPAPPRRTLAVSRSWVQTVRQADWIGKERMELAGPRGKACRSFKTR
jgi:hypothetical protein